MKKYTGPNATKILGPNPCGSDYECLDELRKRYEKRKTSKIKHKKNKYKN